MQKIILEDIFKLAESRARNNGLPYDGAFFPMEAASIINTGHPLEIVDVRTRAEWTFVGHIPQAFHIEWQSFPDGKLNINFLNQLQDVLSKDRDIIFMCRSGVRSHDAAMSAKQAGFQKVFNMIEGFEGEMDEHGHRNSIGGWRAEGLSWNQT